LKVTRELKTGVVVVLVIALFIWGYNYMKGLNLFDGPQKTYFTEYNNVRGLNTASVVTINGVEVGKVVHIKFNNDPKKRGKLIVEFSVENDFQFSVNSIAKIYSASLMGGKSLAVVPSYEGKMAEPGDFLEGEIESDIFSSVTEKLNPLQAKVENVIVSADSLMVGLNDIIDVNTRENLKRSIEDLSMTISNFKEASEGVSEMITENKIRLANTLDNAETLSKNLVELSDSLVASNIAGTIKDFEMTLASLNGILSGMESGEGTIGKLLTDEEMYTNLTNASKELEELLNEMKLHPKRFVHFSIFGKKAKGYDSSDQKEN